MTNIETVLEKSDSILVDGSILSNGTSVLNYLEFDNPETIYEITEKIRKSQLLIHILNTPSARTIPAVANEKLAYHARVTKALYYFTRQPNCPPDLLEAIKELHKSSFQEYETADKNSSSITHPAYQTLHKMVLLLSQTLTLKHDTSYAKGQKPRDDSYNSDTDEQLASTILWESMIYDHCPVLLSNDRDLENLLTIVPWLLGSKHFLPFNEQFRHSIQKNKFEIYRVYENRTDQLVLPNYTFRFQDNTGFWLPSSINQQPPTKRPIGPEISKLTPLPIKQSITVQYQLYQYWEKLKTQL